jgi:hypothetical protein
MIDAASIPRKNPQAAYRSLADGAGGVILHLETGQYHGINEVGCTIWELIDGRRTTADIANAVREKVDGAPPQLFEEVATFLQGMRERGLLAD